MTSRRIKLIAAGTLLIAVLLSHWPHEVNYLAGIIAAALYYWAKPEDTASTAELSNPSEAPHASRVLLQAALRFTPLLLIGGFWALTRSSYGLGAGLLAAFAVVQTMRSRFMLR